jgi:hypothetical protein
MLSEGLHFQHAGPGEYLSTVPTRKPETFPTMQPFRVYARWRPLLPSEEGNEQIERDYLWNETSLSSLSINAPPEPGPRLSRSRSWKSGAAFAGIFDAGDNNKTAFDAVVAPVLPQVLQGKTCNFFAYGHSGSGKSHTIVGYDYENND